MNKLMQKTEPELLNDWQDILREEYYADYINSLTSKELNQELNKDIENLARALSQVTDREKTFVAYILSRLFEFYVTEMVEKEIDLSLKKIIGGKLPQ